MSLETEQPQPRALCVETAYGGLQPAHHRELCSFRLAFSFAHDCYQADPPVSQTGTGFLETEYSQLFVQRNKKIAKLCPFNQIWQILVADQRLLAAQQSLRRPGDPGLIYSYLCTQAIAHRRNDWIHQMQKHRLIFIGLLVACHWLLSACGPMTIKDTANQTFVPIQGWVLELHQEVTIPPNRTRIFFQDGRVLYGINEYEPHCQLRVRPISEKPQPVHADRFTIEKAFGNVDSIVSNGPIRLAAAATAVVMGGGGDGDGPSQVIYFYFMGLHSDRQPDVSYLVCGGALNDPALARYPTLQEIRAALGDYATLVTPGDS